VNNRKSTKREDGRTELYGYDAALQLTAVDYGDSTTQGFSYDPMGNLNRRTNLDATVDSFTPNNLNQYSAINASVPAYDNKGNLLTRTGGTYTYDGQNRLVTVTRGTNSASFVYDGRNRCVRRTINGLTTDYVYDEWNLIAEYSGSTPLEEYVHGPNVDEMLAKATAASTVYYSGDALNSTAALTDGNGNVVERYHYTAFGLPTILDPQSSILVSSAYGNRMLFQGREWLAEFQLSDHRNRYYTPELQRWLSRDPIAERGGINLYGFVGNDPVARLDRLGLKFGNPVCDRNGSVVCPSTWGKYPCCVESLDIVMSGPFQGGLTANDYLPSKDASLRADNPGEAGMFVNQTFVGVKVQFVSSTLFASSRCSFSQELTVVEEVAGGVPTGREGKAYDDIEKSGWDQSKPPFRQSVNCSPSMADVVTMNNTPQSRSFRMYTTCLKSGGDGVAFCKNRECCIKWLVQMEVDANGKVKPTRLEKLSSWCR
jgi:RHS repeat-associated protein